MRCTQNIIPLAVTGGFAKFEIFKERTRFEDYSNNPKYQKYKRTGKRNMKNSNLWA